MKLYLRTIEQPDDCDKPCGMKAAVSYENDKQDATV